MIRKDRVAKIFIQTHLLDFLRGEDLDASETVDKLPGNGPDVKTVKKRPNYIENHRIKQFLTVTKFNFFS